MIRAIANKLGIDGAILYTTFARIIQAIAGIVSILFVAKYLTGVEQGFYYTFGSIVAIQVFFELGLNSIITQYVAHEISYLKWESPFSLVGEAKYKSRLSSLLHFCVKWYVIFAALLFLALIVAGFIFFNYYGDHTGVLWNIPWILLAMGTALNLLLAPILAFLEGLGKVKEIAKIRFCQQIAGLLVVCIGLFAGAKLYVAGINLLVSIILIITWILRSDFKSILFNIWNNTPLIENVSYRKEIFPYQWKIALSWVSGYFIFQLFNPVLFATEGAIVAGQMGMTLAILNGIQALSLSWITTKVPLFSGLIAQKQYSRLDPIFNRTLKQSVSINGIALIFLFTIVYIIRYFHITILEINLGDRFLSSLPMLLMMIPLFINQFVNSWATYLRCHKQEPFLINSISGGILCCLSTTLLGKYYGVLGITSGYCLITFFMSFWGYWIFKTKKNEWHK